jgi:heme-degrading monooxygenase HmoA
MIALFFDVLPRDGHETTYFDMAARLKPALDASGGLLFLDRSRSASRPGWFLSHQFWRDEASMARWRANAAHYRAQACGRADILADYRLRVAAVVASVSAGGEIGTAPAPAIGYNDPAVTPERFMVSLLADAGTNSGADLATELAALPGETFASVYDAALRVHVMSVNSAADGQQLLAWAQARPHVRQARLCLVSRDYTMLDRAEAPQYFAPPIVTLG